VLSQVDGEYQKASLVYNTLLTNIGLIILLRYRGWIPPKQNLFYLGEILQLCSPKRDPPYPITTLCNWQSLLFQQLQVLFTLYSEFFSSFPYGTFALSVSHRVFSLGWSIPPRFRLHSQATRLCDIIIPSVDPKVTCPSPLLRVSPYGNITLYVAPFQVTLDYWDCTGSWVCHEATFPND